MWYRTYARTLHRARRLAKRQMRALLQLEVEGLVALTLHTPTRTLHLNLPPDSGAQVATELREALRQRRRQLKAEQQQLRELLSQQLSPTLPAADPPTSA